MSLRKGTAQVLFVQVEFDVVGARIQESHLTKKSDRSRKILIASRRMSTNWGRTRDRRRDQMNDQPRTLRGMQQGRGSRELPPLSAAFVGGSGDYGRRVVAVLGESDHDDYGVAGYDACFESDGAVDGRDRKMPTC